MILPNLTHLSIDISRKMSFDVFEIFISKLNSKIIKILSLSTTMEDIAYLDANRWEEFIRNKLPQLEKFYFKYTAYFTEDYQTPMYLGQRDQFNSLFWIKRQWILEIENDFENLIFLIRPYKNRWYEDDIQQNSIEQLSKSIRLSLDEICPERWTKTIFIDNHINYALTMTHIYHLEIQTTISSGKLMEILNLLPNVNTLQIYSLPITQQGDLSIEDIEFLCFLSDKKQIKKLYLENIKDMDEAYMLALICSRVNHLQIKCIDYLHAEALTGLILSQIKSVSISALRLLCFSIPNAHIEMIEKLEKMIDNENLHFDFIIKHFIDKICLQWK